MRGRRLLAWIDQALAGVNYLVHVSEGAFFLWMWLPDLPITDRELYERLKARGLLIVPGSYFFPGLQGNWPHQSQCIRLSYGQDMSKMKAKADVDKPVGPNE